MYYYECMHESNSFRMCNICPTLATFIYNFLTPEFSGFHWWHQSNVVSFGDTSLKVCVKVSDDSLAAKESHLDNEVQSSKNK